MVEVASHVLADLVRGIDGPGLVDAESDLLEPVWLIDLSDPRGTVDLDPAALARACRLAPRWLIGVDPDGTSSPEVRAALDVTLSPCAQASDRTQVGVEDPWTRARELAARVAAVPAAALVFRRVLRLGDSLDVHEAIEVESLAYSTLLAGGEYRHWLNTRRPVAPPPDVDHSVRVARSDDEVLSIRLDRPERRNSYCRALRDELVEALRVALLDPSIRQVHLSGEGAVFCSGGDLGEFGLAPDPAMAHLVRTTAGAAHSLAALNDRSTVHCQGASVGAGVELAAFAGTLVAAPGATFRLPELEMGLIPGAGGTASLPRRIGRWRTAHLVLSGAVLDVDEALAWGLIDDIAPLG